MPDNHTEDPSDFAAVFVQHAKGRAADEATTLLAQAVEAARQTGKDAKVNVQLTIKPVPKIPGAYRIEDKVTASIPEEPRTSMWFGDDKGRLHRNQPGLYGDVSAETMPGVDGKSAAGGRD